MSNLDKRAGDAEARLYRPADVGAIDLGLLDRRAVEGRFHGGSITRHGRVMLPSAVDRRLGLIEAGSRCNPDPRNPLLITYDVRDMLRQRVRSAVTAVSARPSMMASTSPGCASSSCMSHRAG